MYVNTPHTYGTAPEKTLQFVEMKYDTRYTIDGITGSVDSKIHHICAIARKWCNL